MHESFCLLKHVINPRSPRTPKLEVRSNWASRRRKGWHETVSGFINSIECTDVVNNTQITVKTVMRLIKDKMTEQDNDEFATELFMKCCSSSTTELSHSLQSLSFKCTYGLEYRPVSIANGNAPVLKSAIVRLTERGMLDSTNCSAFSIS
jgi:hypothetical protein